MGKTAHTNHAMYVFVYTVALSTHAYFHSGFLSKILQSRLINFSFLEYWQHVDDIYMFSRKKRQRYHIGDYVSQEHH